MFSNLFVILLVTLSYAGYNIFVKFSSSQNINNTNNFVLTSKAYLYAMIAGISIGIAEIGYFVLFNPTNTNGALNANVAIPIVLGGTILITMFLSFYYFKESYNLNKIIGTLFIIIGIYLILVKKAVD
tara:strand:+ start:257 stop:640 length:384 start_codon:yes stop_codon:yes gene_type:complete